MKKIIAIFILLVTTSASAGWLFSNYAEDAMDECREGANRGWSCVSAGEWYSGVHGDGSIKKNHYMALEAYRMGCKLDLAEACFLAGVAQNEGKGNVDVDHFSALRFFKKSCYLDDDRGCDELGDMHSQGKGTIANNSKAVRSYRKACKLNNPYGCNSLGIHYQYGSGVGKSKAGALKYFVKACNLELQEGCDNYSKFK